MRRLITFIAIIGAFAVTPIALADPPIDNELAKFCSSLTKEQLNLHPECNTVKHIIKP